MVRAQVGYGGKPRHRRGPMGKVANVLNRMLAVYGGSPLRLHLADGLARGLAVAAMAVLILLK